MGCPDLPTAGLDRDLSGIVAVVRREGDAEVVIGVVGEGARDVRALLPDLRVRRLQVDEDLPLDVVAGSAFPVPDRCLIVARHGADGWDWALAHYVDRVAPPPVAMRPVPKPPRPTEPPPAKTGAQVGLGGIVSRYPCNGIHRRLNPSPLWFAVGELDHEPGYFFVGVAAAPLLAPSLCQTWGAAYLLTGGAWLGGDDVRVGFYGNIGLIAAQVGVRVAVTPWTGNGARVRVRGIEVRAAPWRLAPLGRPEMSVSYTVAWRPADHPD